MNIPPPKTCLAAAFLWFVAGTVYAGEANLGIGLDTANFKLNKSGTRTIFSVNLIVENSGKKAARGVEVAAYLSDDALFSVNEDQFLGIVSLADKGYKKIGRKGKQVGPFKAKFKADEASTSGKFLVMVVDPRNLVPESDESNNVVIYGPLP